MKKEEQLVKSFIKLVNCKFYDYSKIDGYPMFELNVPFQRDYFKYFDVQLIPIIEDSFGAEYKKIEDKNIVVKVRYNEYTEKFIKNNNRQNKLNSL